MKKKIDLKKLRNEIAKFDGDPPFNTIYNICIHDVYYLQEIENRYDMSLSDLRKLLRQQLITWGGSLNLKRVILLGIQINKAYLFGKIKSGKNIQQKRLEKCIHSLKILNN